MESLRIHRRNVILKDGRCDEIWTLSCSGVILTQQAPPFSAGDGTIYFRRSDYNEGLWPSVKARRAGDTVVWINDLDFEEAEYNFENTYPLPKLGARQMLVYDAEQYQAEVGSGTIEQLPPITTPELSAFLRCLLLPDPSVAIYFAGDKCIDALPGAVVASVQRWLDDEIHHFIVSDAPREITELRIGLDMLGFPEALWSIGATEHRLCIFFRSHPCFRVWISAQCSACVVQSILHATSRVSPNS